MVKRIFYFTSIEMTRFTANGISNPFCQSVKFWVESFLSVKYDSWNSPQSQMDLTERFNGGFA